MQVILWENYVTFIHFYIKMLSLNFRKVDKQIQKQVPKPRRLMYLVFLMCHVHIYFLQLNCIQRDVQHSKEILTALLILPTAQEVVGQRRIVTRFLAYKRSYIWNEN